MKKIGYRRICLDFHYADFAPDVLKDVNPKKMVRIWKGSHVDAVMFFLKDHWGNVYYDSDLPSSLTPRLKNVPKDLFGNILEEAKKVGLSIIGYTTVEWDENYARRFPECVRTDVHGQPVRQRGKWRYLCLNSFYADFFISQCKEMVTKYKFPAFFVDIVHMSPALDRPVCFCRYCQKKWKEEFNENLPKEFDHRSRALYLRFRDKTLNDFLRRVVKEVKKIRPEILFTHNVLTDPHQIEFDDYLIREAEPWGKDYFCNSIQSKLYRSLARGKPFEIVTARFNQLWDFTIKSEEQLTWEMATILTHKAEIMIIDQPDIKGNLFPEVYQTIKKVYRKASQIYHELSNSQVYAEIGIMCNNILLKEFPQDDPSFVAACKFLTDFHLPFDVINTEYLTLEGLKKFSLVIISNLKNISEKNIKLIQQYIQEGGKVLFTYKTGFTDELLRPYPMNKRLLSLFKSVSELNKRVVFVKTKQSINNPFVRANNGALKIERGKNQDVLGTTVLPAMEETEERWISHNIHPGIESKWPSIIRGRFGKGQFIYLSFDFFKEYSEQDLVSFLNCFWNLMKNFYKPLIFCEAPRTVEINYYLEGKNIKKITLTNGVTGKLLARTSGEELSGKETLHCNINEVVPIYNIRLSLPGRINKKVRNISKHKLKVIAKGYESIVELERLDIFDVITLRKN